MAKQNTCECSHVVRGETDDEALQGVREDMRQDHPGLLDKVSRDELLGWVEKV